MKLWNRDNKLKEEMKKLSKETFKKVYKEEMLKRVEALAVAKAKRVARAKIPSIYNKPICPLATSSVFTQFVFGN